MATDTDDYTIYLEELNGGPLALEVLVQTSDHYEDVSNSEFDLYEIGQIKDKGTKIDSQWRKETRPKRIRPKSAKDRETEKMVD